MTDAEVKEQLAREVRVEDLCGLSPAATQAIEAIGIEAFVLLAEAIGGVNVYIPKWESVVAAARDRLIIQEFSGSNYAELAIKYNISEVWARNVVNRDRLKKHSISLFDGQETAQL